MSVAISKDQLESQINSRFSGAFQPHEKRPAEVISSGIPEVDSFAFGGLPRGAITEIFGPASSGRTSFMLSTLRHATNHDEVCAVVDTNNSFDPKSAAAAEINFERLLWIRCNHNLEHAFKAIDLLLQGGGFGLVTLDLGDLPASAVKRIISSWWYRFRRTLEPTPTALVVIAEDSCVRSCAALSLGLQAQASNWSATETSVQPLKPLPLKPVPAFRPAVNITGNNALSHARLLQGLTFGVHCLRPLYLNKTVGRLSLRAGA
jgi:recombination protein RecA